MEDQERILQDFDFSYDLDKKSTSTQSTDLSENEKILLEQFSCWLENKDTIAKEDPGQVDQTNTSNDSKENKMEDGSEKDNHNEKIQVNSNEKRLMVLISDKCGGNSLVFYRIVAS